MKVPGLNSGEFFDIFMYFFYPMVAVLLEYLNPTIYGSLSLLCNSVAVTSLYF